MTSDDEQFLRRAIELAAKARAVGDAPFGSLRVGPDGSVLIEGHGYDPQKGLSRRCRHVVRSRISS